MPKNGTTLRHIKNRCSKNISDICPAKRNSRNLVLLDVHIRMIISSQIRKGRQIDICLPFCWFFLNISRFSKNPKNKTHFPKIRKRIRLKFSQNYNSDFPGPGTPPRDPPFGTRGLYLPKYNKFENVFVGRYFKISISRLVEGNSENP